MKEVETLNQITIIPGETIIHRIRSFGEGEEKIAQLRMNNVNPESLLFCISYEDYQAIKCERWYFPYYKIYNIPGAVSLIGEIMGVKAICIGGL